MNELDRFELKKELVAALLRGEVSIGLVGRTIRKDGLQLTQQQVCKILGLSRQVVSDIENDTGNPRLDSLQKYFALMGLEIAVLPRQRSELNDEKDYLAL